MKNTSLNEKTVLERFKKGAFDNLPEKERDILWKRIVQSTEKTKKNVFGRFFYPWAAAACVIALLVSVYWWYNQSVRISVSDMQIIETKAQQKTKIVLPDLSVVWLNTNSRLEYPENFADNERFVNLDGEAYFSIIQDSLRPFIVHASGLDVKVLGTAFNVTAYGNESEVITTLVKGEIALQLHGDKSRQATMLKPEQQVTFHKHTKILTFATVDPELYTAWIKGYYKFENTSFKQIAKQFEHTYGVTITFDVESLKSVPYTGTFLQEQSLVSVLELLRGIKDFHYTITGNQVIISQ